MAATVTKSRPQYSPLVNINKSWVTAYNARFASGDGAGLAWPLPSTVNVQVDPGGTQSFYRTDWRGTSLLYPTPRTNFCIKSQKLDDAAWTNLINGTGVAPTVTADYGPGPEGGTTAERIQFNQGAGTTVNDYSLRKTPTMAGLTVGQPVVVSFWAKSNTSAQTLHMGGGTINGTNKTFNLTTTLQRFTILMGNSNVTSGYLYFGLRGTISSGLTADITITDFQVEQNALGAATSFILTDATAVTVTDYTLSGGVITLAQTTNPAVSQRVVTNSGSGDGVTTAFLVSPAGNPTLSALYKTDWQGTQLLYSTARTNKWRQSTSLITAPNTASTVVVAPVTTTAPDGTTSGVYSVTPDVSNTFHALYQSITHTVAAWAMAVYVKPNGYNYCYVGISGSVHIGINLLTGATFGAAYGATATATVRSDGWVKIVVTGTGTASAELPSVRPYPTQTALAAFAGDAVNGILVWHPMNCLASELGSDIPTTGSEITITDYTLATNTATLSPAPAVGSLITWSGSYTGGLGVGASLGITGSYGSGSIPIVVNGGDL